jgi:ornithine carbamoyltransferase
MARNSAVGLTALWPARFPHLGGGTRRARSIPVINALTDLYHPCQALADYFTLSEKFGRLKGLKLAYVGDGNNVCHSLLITGAKLGVTVNVATPQGFEPKPEIVEEAKNLARKTGAKVHVNRDPVEAVAGVHAVYTDVWASMGQEYASHLRAQVFPPYRVTEGLMAAADPSAVFMHCLPAHRGQEVTDAAPISAAVPSTRQKPPARRRRCSFC